NRTHRAGIVFAKEGLGDAGAGMMSKLTDGSVSDERLGNASLRIMLSKLTGSPVSERFPNARARLTISQLTLRAIPPKGSANTRLSMIMLQFAFRPFPN